LHHGGRNGHGVPGRRTLLVAQNIRATLPRMARAYCRNHYISWIQSDVFSAIRPWLPRDAPTLSYLPGRISNAQCPLDGRGFRSRRRLHLAAALSNLVVLLRTKIYPESL